MCAGACGCAWACTGVHTAQVSAGMHRCVLVRAGMRRGAWVCAQVCLSMCRCEWKCVGVCECVWDEFSKYNTYWRIESLYQRTLICILYKFLLKVVDTVVTCGWLHNHTFYKVKHNHTTWLAPSSNKFGIKEIKWLTILEILFALSLGILLT